MTLRSRLLIVAFVLLATYAGAALAVVSNQRALLIDQVDERLIALPPNSFTSLGAAPPGATRDIVIPVGDGVQRESPFSDLYVGLEGADGTVQTLLTGSSVGGQPDVAAAVDAAQASKAVVTVRSLDGEREFRAIVYPQPDGMSWLVAARPLDEVHETLRRLERTLWIGGGIVTGVIGLALFWIQRLGLNPIARVTTTAEAIAAGDRTQRVPVTHQRTEAGKLGRAFNVMLDERDAAEQTLKQFVADASHELRTPLTSVRGYLELLRQGAFRQPEQLDDVVRRLSAESARMGELVEELLMLASLDEGRPLRLEPIDLGQILRDAAQDARAVQPERPIEVEIPSVGPRLLADQALTVQLVGILVTNALAHTPTSAAVMLGAHQRGTDAVFTVIDRGPGLEPSDAKRVFDRFWRVESSRPRAHGVGGSNGLGLAIARSIAGAHGGTIELETSPGNGCAFTVRLPTGKR